MIPAQFNVDIISEIEQILPSYSLSVPSFVIDEVESIKKRSKGSDKIAASVALKIAHSPNIKIIKSDLRKNENVDNALLRISKILCTNDVELRKKARSKGIAVVYLRQKKYLTVDGHLNY
ncbi:MAG: twitching motility protein PilT [Euryarchaeota archaeon]|nr:twitching motility protein PilT [Euryarchaeota archaeon]